MPASATWREGRDAVLSVSDDGRGLEPEMLSRVFDLFARDTRDGSGGLGLGLTLVKRLTQLHGGSVEARSEGPGHGSEFRVRLPLALEAAANPTRRQPTRVEDADPPELRRVMGSTATSG